jgi:LacI family transcriptional regulator
MAVTIHEIAAQVGLSAKSVSRILRDENAPHRAETRERVLAAARDMGYRANGSARAMRAAGGPAVSRCC